MYLHKEDYFKDIVMDVSNRSGITDDIIEKDYYITLILRELARRNAEIVFKGGTSLSKAHHIIDRFSEDVDITFTEHIGSARRKKLKYMLYTLLPSYTIMLGFYLKQHYFLKMKRPANYDIFISIYDSIIENSIDKKLFDYYFIKNNFSFIETNDIIASQFLLNMNEKVFIEDQQILIEKLETKGNFEAFENTLDQIVTSRIIDMIPVLAEENEIEESECKAIFGIQYYFIRLLFNAYNNEMSFLKGRHFVIIGDRVLNSK